MCDPCKWNIIFIKEKVAEIQIIIASVGMVVGMV